MTARCVARGCDHRFLAGHASVDSDMAGTWHIVTEGGRTSGTGGRSALIEALARHGLEPREWRSGWAGYDETREFRGVGGRMFSGLNQVSRESCQVWSVDWSHA